MMAKEIGSLQRASIWWLIALISAGLLHVAHCQEAQPECMTELFVLLDNDDTNIAQAEKRLRAVFIEERDTTKIGTVSVARILNLRDEPCSAADLVSGNALLKESDFNCNNKPNRGAAAFFRKYGPKWQESCAKLMKSVWDKLFSAKEKKILQGICPDSRRGFFGRLVYAPKQNSVCDERAGASVLIDKSNSVTERENIISACDQLLRAIITDGDFLPDKYQPLSRWLERKVVCEYYLECLCRSLDGELTDDEREKCKGIQRYIPGHIKDDPLKLDRWPMISN